LHFDNEEYELIHLAHAENIKDQIELSCSAYSSIPGNILIAVCYTPHSSLRAREKKVRDILAEFDDRNVDMHYDHLLTEIAV